MHTFGDATAHSAGQTFGQMLAGVFKKNSVEKILGKNLLSAVHTFEDATAQSAGQAFEQMLAGVLERK